MGTLIGGLLLFVVLVMTYFLPLAIAEMRGRDGTLMIGLLNLFLGWTVLGWVILLVIAFTGESGESRRHREEELRLLRELAQGKSKEA